MYKKTYIALGILLCLMPFIAVPYAWKGWLAAACGALVIILVMLEMRKAAN